jgi:hypothetical protein
MHVPYPVFLRIKGAKGKSEFICIAVGIRSNRRPTIFSPYFSSQNEKLWRLVQSHVSQVIVNDFNMRVHLGLYHFTTNQYNVPMYRVL